MRRGWITAIAVLALLAAGCGGGDDADEGAGGTGGSASEEQRDVDPNGTVRLAYDIAGASRNGFYWEPAAGKTEFGDIQLFQWVYGGLMRKEADGRIVPDLAAGSEVVGPTTIEVEIREGVELPDGSLLDGAAVKAAIDRNLGMKGNIAFKGDFFRLSSVDLVDEMTVRFDIPDGSAASWHDTFLVGVETVIVPEGTDFDLPDGAGPMKVVEYTPGESALLEKDPDYWDADAIQVGAVELVHVPDTQAAVAALNAGQVDFAAIQQAQVDAVRSPNELLGEPTINGVANFMLCKEEGPLVDERVRQALSMAIDRESINDAVYEGKGAPAWDLFPEGHRFHHPDLAEHYAFDPERAKELLAEAGQEDGLSFYLIVFPASGMPEIAQIVQQGYADIGVQVNIVASGNPVQDFYVDRKADAVLVPVVPAGTGRLSNWTGDTINNVCRHDDPELNQLAADLPKVSEQSEEAVALWREVQEKVVRDEALSIFVLFAPRYASYNPEKLDGVQMAGDNQVVTDLRRVRVKA